MHARSRVIRTCRRLLTVVITLSPVCPRAIVQLTQKLRAVEAKQDMILEMLRMLTTCLDQLERKVVFKGQPRGRLERAEANSDRSHEGPIDCRKLSVRRKGTLQEAVLPTMEFPRSRKLTTLNATS